MGSKPSAPVTVMPAPTAPTLYQSVTPLTAFEDAAEQLQRIQQETAKIQGQRYQEVGTPAKLGALQAGRRTLEAASYLSSVPQGDRYLESTTGVSKPFEPLREAAKENLSEAQKEYAKALAKVGEVPQPTISETPSWAKRTVT